MIITKILKAQKKPRIVNIILEDGVKYSIHKDVILKFGLRKGDPLTEGKLTEILFYDEFYRAKDTALKYFSYRQRTEYELRKKMECNKFKTKVIEAVIKNLKNIGLINDKEFAEIFARDTLKKKAIGKVLLKQRLIDKGISKDIINSVVDKYYKGIDEKESALQTAVKQLKKYQVTKNKSTDKQNFARLSSFLARRGFSWDVISQVIHHISNNHQLIE